MKWHEFGIVVFSFRCGVCSSALGTVVEPRSRDEPEFGQRGRRPRPFWKTKTAKGHGQDDMLLARQGQQSRSHGSLRSKLAGDGREGSIGGGRRVCLRGVLLLDKSVRRPEAGHPDQLSSVV